MKRRVAIELRADLALDAPEVLDGLLELRHRLQETALPGEALFDLQLEVDDLRLGLPLLSGFREPARLRGRGVGGRWLRAAAGCDG